jgi:hypothetical protein
MSDLAKKAREAMKSKARRLGGAKDQKTDSSDWTPAPLLHAEMKTGARPIMKPSSKGVGESISAGDTKAALGSAHRGAFKKGGAVKARAGKNLGGVMEVLSPAYGLLRAAQRGGRDEQRDTNEQLKGAMMAGAMRRKDGGGIKDKKALGAIDPSPKRGAAQHYKDGGKLPAPEEATRKSGGGKWIKEAIKKPGALHKALKVKEGENIPEKKLEKAAQAPGKLGQRARLAQTLKRMNRATGGAAMDMAGIKSAGRKAPAKGKGKTNINIVIATGKGQQQPPADVMMPPPAMPIPMPPPPAMGAMGSPAPMPLPPPGAVGGTPPALPPMGRKAGGRITKIARSYKDMEAGAVSGEGRLQKTDIAKLHKGAPARKEGGRISKVARSYKDMTAGAGDGEGRLQKTDIARARKVSGR